MGDDTKLGKKGEKKLEEWLTHPEDGFFCYRLKDQMSGLYGSANMCDYIVYKYPHFYPIECKSTWADRFDFSLLSETQHNDMLEASKVEGVIHYVAVLFASHKRAFLINIKDIAFLESQRIKSLNVTKIAKWKIPYIEIRTVPSRKELLDYDFQFAKEIFI